MIYQRKNIELAEGHQHIDLLFMEGLSTINDVGLQEAAIWNSGGLERVLESAGSILPEERIKVYKGLIKFYQESHPGEDEGEELEEEEFDVANDPSIIRTYDDRDTLFKGLREAISSCRNCFETYTQHRMESYEKIKQCLETVSGLRRLREKSIFGLKSILSTVDILDIIKH